MKDEKRQGGSPPRKSDLLKEPPELIANSVFTFLYRIYLNPTRIVFDRVKGQYVCVSTGWLRKTICLITNLCIPINTAINYGIGVAELPSVTLRFMMKVAHFGYLAWGTSFSYIVWRRMDDVTSIFNEFLSAEKKSTLLGYKRLNRCRLRDISMSWILIGLTLVITSFDNYNGFRSFTNTDLISSSQANVIEPLRQLKKVGLVALYSLKNLMDTTTFDQLENEMIPNALLYFMGIIFSVSNTLRGICFTHLDLMVTCWALQFRGLILKILDDFSQQIKCVQPLTTKEKVQSIRLYMKFVSILEKFNRDQGIIVLTAMASEILYISTSSASFVKEESVQFATFLALSTSFIPFGVAIVAAAEVHKLANKFAFLLKMAFINELEIYCKIPSGQLTVSPMLTEKLSDEEAKLLSDAVTYIHNDLAMNNVGFQGLGFFTISYGLIGSIVAAIATYSLVILQLSEKT